MPGHRSATLPVCHCDWCAGLPQISRMLPLRACLRCGALCANPDCDKPWTKGKTKKVRQLLRRPHPRTGRFALGPA